MQTFSEATATTQTTSNEPGIDDLYPPKLATEERELIAKRRHDLQLDESDASFGVALSGGGIRSATFSLGLFQSLAEHDLIKHVDYLSTVSGGGYFGGFFGKLFLASGHRGATPQETSDEVRQVLSNSQSSPLNWLRENGRYIAPTGSGDYFFAASTYLRNWVAVQYVLGVTLLTLFLLANVLRAWMWTTDWGTQLEVLINNATLPKIWASAWLIIPAAVAAFLLVPLGGAFWITQTRQGNGTKSSRRCIALNYPLFGLLVFIIGSAIALTLTLGPQSLDWIPHSPISIGLYCYILIASLLTLSAFMVARLRSPSGRTGVLAMRNQLSRWLSNAVFWFVMLSLFGLVDSFGQSLYAIATVKTNQVVVTGLITSIIVLLARQFATYLSKDLTKSAKYIRIPTHLLGLVVGVALGLIVASFWAAMAHAILWQGAQPHGDPGQQLLAYYAPPTPEVSLSTENHIVVSSPETSTPQAGVDGPALEWVTAALAIATIISLLTGKTMSFLNLSSIQEFYASRLSRAYLGASNPHRTGYKAYVKKGENTDKLHRLAADVTRVVPEDDVVFSNYHPEQYGGPIHLINVTINETVSGTSQLEQRDRKGMGMAIGPCGVSVARVHHAVWSGEEKDKLRELQPISPSGDRFAVFHTKPTKVESLSLGQWVAVSGAAFSTGLGARTNLGMSLLLGLSNVRIGYWWNSGISPKCRIKTGATKQRAKMSDLFEPMFSTQVYLSDEFGARFHGPHRQRWYLSDGGHFENTAVYELIRRRLPFIILSDNGCDQSYVYDDLANLIRKARIDFNAEIRLLAENELDHRLDKKLRAIIGTPAELQRRIVSERSVSGRKYMHGNAYSRCHAMLARIYYDGATEPGSLLLIIKPSLIGDEPLDILEYHTQHPEFPQESTLDQFFDEAQWESYRKLGSHIGDYLFDAMPSPIDWARNMLKPA